MSKVVIYTAKLCPYCTAAKKLLSDKGAAFDEVDVTFNPAGRAKMSQKAGGRRSVPQIFIGPDHIGGCDELYALEHRGGLEPLLAG